MQAGPELSAEEVAKALGRHSRDIQTLAREAVDRSEGVEWPVLRERGTGKPITIKVKGGDEDKDDGYRAFAVVATPPARRGRPAKNRGETGWKFRQVTPPQPRVTIPQRFLLPGQTLGRGPTTIDAVAAEEGIAPGAPVRALRDAKPGERMHVIAAKAVANMRRHWLKRGLFHPRLWKMLQAPW